MTDLFDEFHDDYDYDGMYVYPSRAPWFKQLSNSQSSQSVVGIRVDHLFCFQLFYLVVPNVVCVSELSILDCLFGFL